MASTVFNGTDLLLKVSSTDGSEANIGHTTSCTISLSMIYQKLLQKTAAVFKK